MKANRDATRRNRNIGTAKQGSGDDSQFTIPFCGASSSPYWERLGEYHTVNKTIGYHDITIIVEKTRPDTCHACTVDDLCYLLQFIPSAHIEGTRLMILRQPKRKEEILDPVWGRYVYYAQIGEYNGGAVVLEARSFDKQIKWPKSLNIDRKKELERLKGDGHIISTTKRGYAITPTIETVRATQLYRTLLHEIGHNVDFMQRVDNDLPMRPNEEREVFAHRYADEMKSDLLKRGIIPFNRLVSEARMIEDGLNLNDFLIS